MNFDWPNRISKPEPLVLDGATGTELEAAGVDVRHPLWGSVALLTEEGRAQTERVHAAYAAAGAELIIANSHNLSLAHVQRWLNALNPPPDSRDTAENACRKLNQVAVDVARRVGRGVAGCLASPEKPYAREASLTPDEVTDRLRFQYRALADAQPDLIIFEMLTTPSDVLGVAQLADLEAQRVQKMPFAVGLVAKDAETTLGGAPWSKVRAWLEPISPAAVFIQCTPVDRVEPALAALASCWPEATLGVYANDGGYDANTQAWTGARTSPAAYAAAARRWVSAGARIIGGCCGTGPAHIAAVREMLNEFEA